MSDTAAATGASAPIQLASEDARDKLKETTGRTFTIYQLKDGDETRDYRFRSLQELAATQLAVDARNYEVTYAAALADGVSPESLYYTFNMDRPRDFTGHSLSVSDVVVLDNGGEMIAFYVDDRGFQELPGFAAGQQQMQQTQAATQRSALQSPIKAAEMTAGQNPDMTGGTPNSTPTVAEREARTRCGRPISPGEPAGTIESEQQTDPRFGQGEGRARPSVREQMRQMREAPAPQGRPAPTLAHSRETGGRA
jgi:hypothetical protein